MLITDHQTPGSDDGQLDDKEPCDSYQTLHSQLSRKEVEEDNPVIFSCHMENESCIRKMNGCYKEVVIQSHPSSCPFVI